MPEPIDVEESKKNDGEETEAVTKKCPKSPILVIIDYMCDYPKIKSSPIASSNLINSEGVSTGKNLQPANTLQPVCSPESKKLNHLSENKCFDISVVEKKSNKEEIEINTHHKETTTDAEKHLEGGCVSVGDTSLNSGPKLNKDIGKSCVNLERSTGSHVLHEIDNNVNGLSSKKYKRKSKDFKKIFTKILNNNQQNLEKQLLLYQNSSFILHRCYWHFKVLEFYTDFLQDLQMFCHNATQVPAAFTTTTTVMIPLSTIMSSSTDLNPSTITSVTTAKMVTSNSAVSHSSKKTYRQLTTGSGSRVDDEEVNVNTNNRLARKLHRQEENYRHMLLPDTPEEINRKDSSKMNIFLYLEV